MNNFDCVPPTPKTTDNNLQPSSVLFVCLFDFISYDMGHVCILNSVSLNLKQNQTFKNKKPRRSKGGVSMSFSSFSVPCLESSICTPFSLCPPTPRKVSLCSFPVSFHFQSATHRYVCYMYV